MATAGPSFIRVGVDETQLSRVRARLDGIKNGFAIAVQGALSDTLTTGRALVARKIAEEVNLKIGTIKKTITVKRPSLRNLTGTITLTKDRAVWLIDYMSAAQKKRQFNKRGTPIAVKVRRRAPLSKYPEKIPKAFIAATPHSQHIGIFQRTGLTAVMLSGRYKGKRREVIRRLVGPHPLRVFQKAKGSGADTILREATAELTETFRKNLESKMQFVLSGKRGLSKLQGVNLG